MGSNKAKAETAEQLSVDLFGGFSISCDGRALDLRNRKSCAILAYLLLEDKSKETRERLAGLLWSETDEDKARASLRQCLRRLRELFDQLGFTDFHLDRTHVHFDSRGLDIDVRHLLEAVKAGRVEHRLLQQADLPGRLLQGFGALDPAYRSWLTVRRQSLTESLMRGLEGIIDDPAAPDTRRQRAAEALIRLDPTHEKACRMMMADLAEKGNIAGALRIYNELWTLLGDEYDMEPALETQELVARIKAGPDAGPLQSPPQPRATSDVPASGSLTIGMTRFPQNPPEPGGDYFVQGFRQDLIASLVRFREWVILDRDDITATTNLAEIRNSGAGPIDYLIEGTGFGSGDERFLIITLKDVRRGQYVWSERYQVSTSNWIATQQEIIRRTAVALSIHISAERLAKQVAEPAIPLGAYDLWLKGQALIRSWDPYTETEAEEIFRRIIESTPNFGPAYSSLASIYNSRHIVFPGVFRSGELEKEAQSYASTAVELDPLDTRAQLALAWSNAMCERYDQAELHYDLAYDLNGSDPATLISCAQGLAFCGRYSRARSLGELAVSMGAVLPDYHWGYLVGIRFLCQDYEGSVEAAELAHDVIANLPGWKAAALAHLRRSSEAQKEAEHFLSIAEANWVGEIEFSRESAVTWFLHSFPIREDSMRERLAEGLRLSGLPLPSRAAYLH